MTFRESIKIAAQGSKIIGTLYYCLVDLPLSSIVNNKFKSSMFASNSSVACHIYWPTITLRWKQKGDETGGARVDASSRPPSHAPLDPNLRSMSRPQAPCAKPALFVYICKVRFFFILFIEHINKNKLFIVYEQI